MPRKKSNWYPGAEYYVTSTGIRKAPLFYDGEDRHVYLEIIGKARAEHRFDLYAYCLMTNQTHLHIKTHQLDILQIINKIDQRYSLFFNRKYQFMSTVYQSHSEANRVDSSNHQLDVNKYIHLTPCRTDLVGTPKEYQWSSYRSYVAFHKQPNVNPHPILSHFSYPQNINYQKFVEKKPNVSITGKELADVVE
ncbi:transposase [Alkalihalobacillus sp. AL-G]|uniref:transposase n=1 Tax=Alkalihalobacillus sp. AL-G TaxID=2926399 RepID=UPI00272BD9B7|nr:transposase [Alkalihalobacillus sp. AL-G]WLD93122.1 transposase [Alkalihalobacillus sp. AL-G]